MPSTVQHVRQAHSVTFDQHGRIIPEQRLSSAETAAIERAGFEVLRQDLAGTWGEFGTLAKSGDHYYLLALA